MIIKVIKGIWKAIIKKNSDERYLLLSKITNFFYPLFCHTERWKAFLYNKEFIKDYKKFEKLSDHSIDRKYMIVEFLKLTKKLSWDAAECWAFKWATSYFILKNIDSKKTLHLFDSFEWLSQPDEIDWTHWNLWSLSTTENIIKENLKGFKNVKYYKWRIPEKFYMVDKTDFSFVHIDVDLYKPTKDSLEFFYPRLQKWGIIICDDYWFITCPGAKKAFDEFALAHNIEIIGLSSWQWLIIKL